MGKGERPEHTAPPEIFYNEDEARKYTTNSRMIAIQVRRGAPRPTNLNGVRVQAGAGAGAARCGWRGMHWGCGGHEGHMGTAVRTYLHLQTPCQPLP